MPQRREEAEKVLRKSLLRLLNAHDVDTPLVRWGVVGIVAILFWSMVVDPFMAWRESRMTQLEARIAKVERLLALQKAAPQWSEAEKNFRKAIEETMPMFVEGASYAEAQNNLLTLLRSAANDLHLQVESQHLAEAERVPGLGERIGIELRLHGKLTDVLALVKALHGARRLLTLESLYIAPMPAGGEALLLIGVSGYRLTSGGDA